MGKEEGDKRKKKRNTAIVADDDVLLGLEEGEVRQGDVLIGTGEGCLDLKQYNYDYIIK